MVIFAGVVSFHLWVATALANDQPGDSKLYVALARNMIEQGMFSAEFEPPYKPTLIRTPGYPLMLAGIYEIAGVGNDHAVRVVQGLLFTLSCILCGLIAFHWMPGRRRGRAGWMAFALTAFCPFMVIYTATVLSEVPTILLLSAMLLTGTYAIKFRKRRRSLIWWAVTGLIGGIAVMIRPDAGLFTFGIGLTLMISVLTGRGTFRHRLADRVFKSAVLSLAFIIPLIPWTIRNEQLFGVFQPLSPAHAEMPGEFVPRGYLLWLRTWIDDSRYIGPMLWNLEDEPLKIKDVPDYAFANEDEKKRVAELFDRYNNSDPDNPYPPVIEAKIGVGGQADDSDSDDSTDDETDASDSDEPDDGEYDLKISPDVDAAFEQLGKERVAREPMKYYLVLPATRSASMWFDTHSDYYPFAGEITPVEDLDPNTGQSFWLPLFAGINAIYTLLAALAVAMLLIVRTARYRMWVILAAAVCLPRMIFFGTIENPEPRYFVELFVPALILGAIVIASVRLRWRRRSFRVELNYDGR